MSAVALRTIQAELTALVDEHHAHPQHQIDPFALAVIAIKIGAQAEMIEKDLNATPKGCHG